MPQRRRLADHVYDSIKQRLVDGDHEMGEQISVDAVVSDMASSRQPVMDALRRLETEGFVEIIPQVGVRVVSPGRQEIRDFFRLFAASEGECAAIAAERADVRGAANLAAINSEIGLLRTSRDDPDVIARRFRTLNREFHGTLYDLTQSSIVIAVSRRLWARSDLYIALTVSSRLFADRITEAYEEHEVLCQAIAANDPVAAHEAMQRHIQHFRSASEKPQISSQPFFKPIHL